MQIDLVATSAAPACTFYFHTAAESFEQFLSAHLFNQQKENAAEIGIGMEKDAEWIFAEWEKYLRKTINQLQRR